MKLYPLFLLMAFVTVLIPGPGVVMTLTNSLRYGLQGAFGGILGIAFGAFVVAAMSSTSLGVDWSEERKEELAAQAIERLKGIHEIDIAVQRILSPKEFQNSTHLYAGALYGLSPLASPSTLFKYRSPIRGLYQAGQTTWPGFGVASAGMSGVLAAQALLRDTFGHGSLGKRHKPYRAQPDVAQADLPSQNT